MGNEKESGGKKKKTAGGEKRGIKWGRMQWQGCLVKKSSERREVKKDGQTIKHATRKIGKSTRGEKIAKRVTGGKQEKEQGDTNRGAEQIIRNGGEGD